MSGVTPGAKSYATPGAKSNVESVAEVRRARASVRSAPRPSRRAPTALPARVRPPAAPRPDTDPPSLPDLPHPDPPPLQRVERMKERVKNLSTPARRPATAADALDAHAQAHASGHHVTFAPGVGAPPRGGQTALPHTPASRVSFASTKTPIPTGKGFPPPPPPSATRECRRAVGGVPPSAGVTPPHVRSERESRVAALRENTNSAQLWCEFLEAEEMALGDETNTGQAPAGRNGVSLFRLFEHARCARFLRFLVTRRARSRGITSGSTSAWRGSRWCPTWTTRGTRSSTSSRRGSGSSTPCSGPSGPRLGFSTRGRRRR